MFKEVTTKFVVSRVRTSRVRGIYSVYTYTPGSLLFSRSSHGRDKLKARDNIRIVDTMVANSAPKIITHGCSARVVISWQTDGESRPVHQTAVDADDIVGTKVFNKFGFVTVATVFKHAKERKKKI